MLDRCHWACVAKLSVAAVALLVGLSTPAAAENVALGDLDGNGFVEGQDLSLLFGIFDSKLGDARYDPAADLDGDGFIETNDASLLYQLLGSSGDVDTTPPLLIASLNGVPDDQNNLLVAPPDGFQITLELDSAGGSLLVPASLVVTSSDAFGPFPLGIDLSSQFEVTPTGAVWNIPLGTDLSRRTHYIAVWVSDVAGNTASAVYGFAVRDFVDGAPLGNLQTIFVDLGQDRSLGPEIDIVEDMREYGLSDPSAPNFEGLVHSLVRSKIIEKMNLQYGRLANGDAGPDSANVRFVSSPPATPHSRICVGGESPQGPLYLGSATYDENNLIETSDECSIGPGFGVFPQAIDNLWGGDPDYQAVFAATDPDLGGIPIGLHPADAAIFKAGFNHSTLKPSQVARADAMAAAFNAFVTTVATATSHEVGHMLGLTAQGNPGGGLYGDALNHNRTATGGTPSSNWVMNNGATFTFAEVAALPPTGMATFRPLNWAYLRDRLAPNPLVTALNPPPVVDSVDPSVLVFQGEFVTITLTGSGFMPGSPPSLELVRAGDPTPEPVFAVTVVDAQTVTGNVNQYFVSPGPYDLRLTNPDGQVVTVEDAILVL